jgi:hypothetical protein
MRTPGVPVLTLTATKVKVSPCNFYHKEDCGVNILMFGPNGSGKGTQGSLIKKKYNLAHIESGGIFGSTSARARNWA